MGQGAEQLEFGATVLKSDQVEEPVTTTTLLEAEANLAPMLRHYVTLKKEYPEHLLLYQVGDFYEVFYNDAATVSSVLQIRLTSRSKDKEGPNAVPMCGVPIHAIDNYLPKLVQAGHSCLLVSQVENGETEKTASGKKGVVKREITRVVTPGIRYEGDGLESSSFNFIGSVILSSRGDGALAYADVSTGFFSLVETDSPEELIDALERLRPVELLAPNRDPNGAVSISDQTTWSRSLHGWAKQAEVQVRRRPFESVSIQKVITSLEKFQDEITVSTSKNLLSTLSLESLSAVQALLDYVDEISFGKRPRLSTVRVQDRSSGCVVDAATQRNLELLRSRQEGDKHHGLVHHIDYTKTAMGSRMLSAWVQNPSTSLDEIQSRLSAVEELVGSRSTREELREHLARVRDLERILSRLATFRASPRDLGILLDSVAHLDQVSARMITVQADLFAAISKSFDPLSDISERLSSALADELPLRVSDGGIFREGYNVDLDALRDIQQHSGEHLLALEAREREQTGISNLKVRYTNAFGYFIEISKTHLAKVPEHYDRRQTLVGAERFVTTELREFEQKILSARARQLELEQQLFRELRDWLLERVNRIRQTADALTLVDVLTAFAHLAVEHGYQRPQFVENKPAEILSGRHPVVECMIGPHNFVANDTRFGTDARRFAILTGPNMGGKSTYLRQIGLIQILAQSGSFVPAQEAKLHLVDKIFTRIGASDDLARGDSTFMVEMREAASILRRATGRSLVLIDEIGRGTATTDGLAIATAIAEWLRDQLRCKTVFATHFHELTELARATNERSTSDSSTNNGVAFCIAVGVLERDKEIVFTHRIEERVADRSYGIEVARLAGLPENVLLRAEQVMAQLLAENGKPVTKNKTAAQFEVKPSPQDQRFVMLKDRLEKLNTDRLTPIQALTELADLKQSLKQDV